MPSKARNSSLSKQHTYSSLRHWASLEPGRLTSTLVGQHSTARLNMILASSGSSSSTAAFHNRTEFGTCSRARNGQIRDWCQVRPPPHSDNQKLETRPFGQPFDVDVDIKPERRNSWRSLKLYQQDLSHRYYTAPLKLENKMNKKTGYIQGKT